MTEEIQANHETQGEIRRSEIEGKLKEDRWDTAWTSRGKPRGGKGKLGETGWKPTWGCVAGWRVRVYMWLEFEWLAGIMEAGLFYVCLFCFSFSLFNFLTLKCKEIYENI